MIKLFVMLFGRLPIGWLQLKHNKSRFAAAIAGVAFANILIFMQLGFLGALKESITFPYKLFNADILVSASDSNTISDGSHVPRVRLYQALSIPEVKYAVPIYVAKVDWTPKDMDTISFQIYGVTMDEIFINNKLIKQNLNYLKILDSALIDTLSRGLDATEFAKANITNPRKIEVNGRTISVIGSFLLGGGFDADGYMIVSDETYASLIPAATLSAPKHILIQVEEMTNVPSTIRKIQQVFRSTDTVVRSYNSAMTDDQNYQTTKRPVGVIFGFGTLIGILVGIVIVYQVLASDVADHLKEYATFKAIGYSPTFFNSIILEEAVILAIYGFIPGMALSFLLYSIVGNATGLPIAMNNTRLIAVFLGTVLMCLVSGLFATRKLHSANPADLF